MPVKGCKSKEMACIVKGVPLSHRLTHEPRCNTFLQKLDVLSERGSRSEELKPWRNVGDLKMGSVGSIRWVVWQDKGGR